MRRPTSVRRPAGSIAPSRRSSSRADAPGRGGRRVEPRERIGVGHAERREHQRQLRQIGARDLGLGLAGPLFEIVARVEAQRASGARAAGATGALGRRRLADARERERRQAGPGRVRRHARQAAVDHGGDAFDRHRRLGDVRRQDDLPAIARAHGARLLLERHLAVQRQHREVADAGQLRQRRLARA